MYSDQILFSNTFKSDDAIDVMEKKIGVLGISVNLIVQLIVMIKQ